MRLELKPSTEMTLRALRALADGHRWTAADLAEPAGTTRANAAHLIAPLARAGWVRSSPGPTGGHELAVDLRRVSLLELIETVEGPTENGRCVMSHRGCAPAQPCALHDVWTRARTALTRELAETPLSTIIDEAEVIR
jgi:Rrf2 family transcriptional regulator, iron-sulfur cluster assembly transcription factor